MAAILSAAGVVKRFGAVTALSGVTVEVTEGITGLLGANGAGKTTLLGLALGLTHPDGGDLEILGLDPVEAGPEVRAIVGYSPEHQSLPPDVRAFDLAAHLAEVHGLPHRAATARASDALYQVGPGEGRFRPAGTMSTGQKQRVELDGRRRPRRRRPIGTRRRSSRTAPAHPRGRLPRRRGVRMSTARADARIIDRGYRPYDGPRLGAAGAVRSLIRHTAQRVMGLRRPFQYKVLPLLSAGIAYVPAIVFVGLSALIKDDRVRQGFLPT